MTSAKPALGVLQGSNSHPQWSASRCDDMTSTGKIKSDSELLRILKVQNDSKHTHIYTYIHIHIYVCV